MKEKIILLLYVLILSLAVSAQTVTRNGNTFTRQSTSKARMDSVATNYFWEAQNIPKTMIFINRNNGRCYIIRKSATTGKTRREYIDENVSKAIAKEMNIPYTYVKRQKETRK